jgi:inorganic pyrophosphatase
MEKLIVRYFFSIAICAAIASFGLHADTDYEDVARNQTTLISPDRYTLRGEKSFLSGYDPINPDGSVNAIIEIPSGTNAKWEVSKPDGILKWEIENGKPRVVDYLSYPGNYGMIPKTILPSESGGDGDPLDVLVLGPAIARGSVTSVKIIGILHLLDRGERDDKLIAVMPGTPLYQVNSMEELDEDYAGISTVIEIWFSNYKGPGKMQSLGFGSNQVAMEFLRTAMYEFATGQSESQKY